MINAFFSALKKIIIINNNKSYALFSHYIYFLSEFIEQLSSFHWTHPLQVWMHVKCKNVWHLSRTKNLKSYPDVFLTTADLYFQPRGPIKKRPPIRANTADEAIEKMLEQKRISTKINYDVLKDLNVKSGASPARKAESPKKEPTATKLTGRNRKPARPPLSLSTPLSTLGKRCVYSMLNNFCLLVLSSSLTQTEKQVTQITQSVTAFIFPFPSLMIHSLQPSLCMQKQVHAVFWGPRSQSGKCRKLQTEVKEDQTDLRRSDAEINQNKT